MGDGNCEIDDFKVCLRCFMSFSGRVCTGGDCCDRSKSLHNLTGCLFFSCVCTSIGMLSFGKCAPPPSNFLELVLLRYPPLTTRPLLPLPSWLLSPPPPPPAAPAPCSTPSLSTSTTSSSFSSSSPNPRYSSGEAATGMEARRAKESVNASW